MTKSQKSVLYKEVPQVAPPIQQGQQLLPRVPTTGLGQQSTQ